ncbi:hypothetical protein RPD_2338 [Rhodopseudomonas palustris BisB5]|uniref:Uncharacterized protein n=1 Tax=Rhodopseudomonas palustris (strain BisB5) TaxID=316057 RepID=Q138B9_RHOPS|nr:hypothetical protein RPD_2338 [Rhodopseudomonas palustris BisB5]
MRASSPRMTILVSNSFKQPRLHALAAHRARVLPGEPPRNEGRRRAAKRGVGSLAIRSSPARGRRSRTARRLAARHLGDFGCQVRSSGSRELSGISPASAAPVQPTSSGSRSQ